MVKRLLLCAAVALLAACAAQSKRQESELAQLLQWLPGSYDNLEQVEADARAGHEPHAALVLEVVRVYAPRIGQHVFYMQETAAHDARRVLAQRIVAFEVVKDRGIVQSLWTLAEPLRWRDAQLNVDLFKGLMPQDFSPMPGCELLWERAGASFVGANDPASCRVTSPASGGRVRMELRAELAADELAQADLSYDSAGRLVLGHAQEPFYRFRKR